MGRLRKKFQRWWADDEQVVTDVSVYGGIIAVVGFIMGIWGVLHF